MITNRLAKTINKTVAALTALCLIALCGCALAEQPNQAEIIKKATDAVRETVTVSDEDWSRLRAQVYDDYLEGHSDKVWVVEFWLSMDTMEAALYTVKLEKHTGGVLQIFADENAFSYAELSNERNEAMLKLEKEKGEMYYWSQQDVVDFFAKYADNNYRMPVEGDLSYEKAIEIATKYAVDSWGMTDEYLSGLHVCANLTNERTGALSIWYVYFVDENIRTMDRGVLAPHMVVLANPSGEVLDASQGSSNSVG